MAGKMTSAEWLVFGREFFGTWPYWFWCSRCKLAFPSVFTPTECPNGHKADSVDDRVVVTHKGYTAATFAFYLGKVPSAEVVGR